MTLHRLSCSLVFLCLAGCATLRPSTGSVSPEDELYARVNQAAISHLVVIEQRGADGAPGEPVLGRGFAVRPDSARWRNPVTGQRRAVPTHTLAAVTVADTFGRTVRWGSLSLYAGLFVTKMLTTDDIGNDPPHGFLRSGGLAGVGLLSGAAFALLGRRDARYSFPATTVR